MDALPLLLAALLAAALVVLVGWPFLREPALSRVEDELDRLCEADERRLALLEERDRALSALHELELDRRMGTVTEEDYRALVGPLRQQAAAALRALEELEASFRRGASGPSSR
jgi:hypothetical protein